MSNKVIEDAIRKGLPSVVLLLGEEGLLVDRARQRVTEAALVDVMAAFNLTTLRAGDESAESAFSVARTLPMMSKRRVVVLRDVQEADAALLESFAGYMEEPSPSTIVIASGTKWPKARKGSPDWGRRLENKVKKAGLVVRFKAKDADPAGFCVDAAKELGCTLQMDDARLLVELSGKDLARLQREVEKAALYVGGSGPIRQEDLVEICSLLAEAVVWELTDALVQRDPDRALSSLHRLLEQGSSSEAHRLISMVAWQIRQLLAVQAAMHGSGGEGVRMPGWKRRKVEEALRRNPLDPAKTLERLARANQDMNSHRAGSRRILEGLVLELVTEP